MRLLLLALIFISQVAAAPFISEKEFADFDCTISGEQVNCNVALPLLRDSFSDGRRYTVGLTYALTVINASSIPVSNITTRFPDGWSYKIKFDKALGCVLLYEEADEQTECFFKFLTFGKEA
jgi:hypothetical protein